ncbi:MAG TPA: sigma-54 dependent transcriptional regulator [Candidatus Limnocylindrales bacterium]|nr:sigma-54 dependent transcriptional regulator [Candidatus Limnocylindrales bacterium]
MSLEKGLILVIDSQEGNLETVSSLLQHEGYEVVSARNGRIALDLLKQTFFNVVITALKMPGVSGMEILKFVKEQSPETVVILMTGYATVESAVEAMKEGAYDYLTKPVNLSKLRVLIRRAIEQQQMVVEVEELRRKLETRTSFQNIIGTSKEIQRVYETVLRVASINSTVLIYGESGTGKELVARAIHHNSPRRDRPLIILNCAALPEGVIESELFGHEKGAFTGAFSTKRGMFELANGGTIFLDEIGEMNLSTQSRLLRVLEEKEFMRVGGTKTLKVDVNIIAATNVDLEKAVAEKTFRKDLYYRLKVMTIKLPPLRERKEDIPLLIRAFIDAFNRENHTKVQGVSREALSKLQNYPWPGNIRELKHCIESIMVTTNRKIIEVNDLPAHIIQVAHQEPEIRLKAGVSMAEVEKEAIRQTLIYTGGNKTKAAKVLNIGLRTLHQKIKDYNLR